MKTCFIYATQKREKVYNGKKDKNWSKYSVYFFVKCTPNLIIYTNNKIIHTRECILKII